MSYVVARGHIYRAGDLNISGSGVGPQIYVRILLYDIYMSSYYYICVFILLYMCPHTAT